MDWPDAAALFTSLAACAGVWVALRRSRPEGRKLDSEAEAVLEQSVEEARGRAEEERRKRIAAERDRDRLERELAELRQRVAILEDAYDALPLAILAPRLLQPLQEGLAAVFDEASDLIAVTDVSHGGRFVWVNRCWEAALGWTKAELLATSWRDLIHPDDLEATRDVESRAWVTQVETVNRYRRKDGEYVTLRWMAAAYQGGVTFALAKVIAGAERRK